MTLVPCIVCGKLSETTGCDCGGQDMSDIPLDKDGEIVRLERRLKERDAEIERLRTALEGYACPGLGNCREPKLDDGSCLVEASGGRCGDEAYCALRALDLSAEDKT